MAQPLTHFEIVNKRGEKRPACRPFARNFSFNGRYVHFHMTTDKGAVTCTKCAKIGGFAAAAIVEKTQSGTCQCCFGAWKLMPQNTSLHGYKRPGHGWIVGKCWGSQSVPFEVSCEKTKAVRAEYQRLLGGMKKDLENFQTGNVAYFIHEVREYNSEKREYETALKVEVKKGAEETRIPYVKGRPWDQHTVPSFEALRIRAIANTENQIKRITLAIAELDDKIANWKQIWSFDTAAGRYVTM